MKTDTFKYNKLFFFLMLVFFLSTCSSSIIKKADSKSDNGRKTEKSKWKKDERNYLKKQEELYEKKSVERENKLLKKYNEDRKIKFEELLVDINRYTTNGKIYQKKYYKHLIGIAIDISDNKHFTITKGSIGFYYDRKSENRNRLYLGLDVDVKEPVSNNYSKTAITLLRKHLKDILETINSCKTIFREKEVEGIVIGFRWNSYKFERVNLWIKARDVILFEQHKLTFEELIQRSTVTNTSGRIIMLSI